MAMRASDVLYLNYQDFHDLRKMLDHAESKAAVSHFVAANFDLSIADTRDTRHAAVVDAQETAIVGFYMSRGIFDLRRFMFRQMELILDPQAPPLSPARLMAEDMVRSRS